MPTIVAWFQKLIKTTNRSDIKENRNINEAYPNANNPDTYETDRRAAAIRGLLNLALNSANYGFLIR